MYSNILKYVQTTAIKVNKQIYRWANKYNIPVLIKSSCYRNNITVTAVASDNNKIK